MKPRVLDWLVCPICRTDLSVGEAQGQPPVPSREASPPSACRVCRASTGTDQARPCPSCYGIEIQTGTVICKGGHSFPIRAGVPRLLPSQELSARAHGGHEVGDSFGKEWSHFSYDDRTWAETVQDRCQLFLKEVAISAQDLKSKVILDAGCGNGSLSRGLNQFGCEVVAADVSDSVVSAYKHFAAKGNSRTHFIQADLMANPFRADAFDVIYSSGVLHHNPNTRAALRAIVPSLAPGGRVYIWVYSKQPGVAHALKGVMRRFIAPLPAGLKHTLIQLWLPQAMARQHLRKLLGRSSSKDQLKPRERLVLLLDHYTPRYRWEHTPDEVTGWYQELGYEDRAVTEVREWGFGAAARRPAAATGTR